MTEQVALLGGLEEDSLWDACVEEPEDARDADFGKTVDNLLDSDVIKYLARQGVVKVAEFCVQDKVIMETIEDDSIVTLATSTPYIDYEAVWKRDLEARCRGFPGRKDSWSVKVPVVAYCVSVRHAASRSKGILHRLVNRYLGNGCDISVFSLPAVHAVIDYKWTTYAKRFLIGQSLLYCTWALGFYIFTVMFQDEDTSLSLMELLGVRSGCLAVIANAVALLGMTPFIIIEFSTAKAYTIQNWTTVWNVLDTVTYALQIYIIICHTCRWSLDSGGVTMACSLQSILLLFRLQYFSRVFPNTRFSFVDDLRAVLSDVKYYLLFLMLIIAGYAASFHILFRYGQDEHEEFKTYQTAFLSVLSWSFSGPELLSLYQGGSGQENVMAYILGVSFAFIMGMILINMLIGLMTTSLENLSSKQHARSLLSKAMVIDEIEMTIPDWIYNRVCSERGKEYVHVLRVDPDNLDKATKESLWPFTTGVNTEESESLESIRKTLNSLQKEIAELKAILVEAKS
jgi:hypothetical protein